MPGFHEVPATAPVVRVVLTAVALLLCGACVTAGRAPATPCPANFVQVDVTVGADPGEPLELSPSEAVTVFLPSVKPGDAKVKRQVCWVVGGLSSRQTLHIQRKSDPEDYFFPSLERTVKAPRTTAKSGVPKAAGTWVYELWVTEGEGDERLHYTDPEVIIRDQWP